MKFVLTGSLGHITRPLATALIEKGHAVTVISSKAEKQKEIESIGAAAAIGNIEDPGFLTRAFSETDIVYCMVPYPDTAQPLREIFSGYIRIAENYKQAIVQTGIKKVVDLSTVGAHMKAGNGLLQYAYEIEQVFNSLPEDISVKFMRPVSFYYNVLSYIPLIKEQSVIAANYGGETKKPWVSPIDIAAAIAEAMLTPFQGKTIQYIASEELSCNQIAAILGRAIGIPGLQWITLPGEQVLEALVKRGMEPSTAGGFVEMNAGIQSGVIYEDYYKHTPYTGKTGFKDYAEEFAQIYNS